MLKKERKKERKAKWMIGSLRNSVGAKMKNRVER